MAKKKELSRIEEMEIFHQDGVMEIVFGATLLNFGFDLLNEMTFTSLFTYVPIVLLSSMKNQVTVSRIGYEAFDGDEIKVRNWNLYTAVGMVVILMALNLFVLSDSLNLQEMLALPAGRNLPALFTGIILALGSLAAALLIPLKRFYLYAGVALVMAAISFFLFPAQVLAFAFAGVLLGNGARLMISFARKYPLNKEEKKDQEKKKEK